METNGFAKRPTYWVLWSLLSLYVLISILSNVVESLWILTFPLALAYAAVYAAKYYGWKAAAIFVLISVVISLAYENLSIATGFPFGWYHWARDKNPGPWVGTVPVLTAIAYCGTGYISWALATILVSFPHREGDRPPVLLTPVLAAFIMVMWDMSMDPMSSTVFGVWVWHHGGGYYGVPLSNFLGWWLVVYTIYQLFSLYLFFVNRKTPLVQRDVYWYQGVLMYFLFGLSNLLPSELSNTKMVTDKAGHQWMIRDVYEGTLTVAIFTMGFVCVLAATRIYRHGKKVSVSYN